MEEVKQEVLESVEEVKQEVVESIEEVKPIKVESEEVPKILLPNKSTESVPKRNPKKVKSTDKSKNKKKK